ncbi:hypothetical protein N5P32_00995, partial [Marinomonas pontica]|nr:hypothetical protein [Marinomonas pontica]
MKLKEYIPAMKAAYKLKRISLQTLKAKTDKCLPIIVTLTSIPSRLGIIDLTIRSLLNQTNKPQKILLWLNEDLRHQIPKKLTELEGDIFEIRYQKELTCSHRKLIYSLLEFPETTLVTCDDDLIYSQSWLESLHKEHQQHPNSVIANECRMISYDTDGELLPYKQWKMQKDTNIADQKLLPIGYGGVLYPAHSLHTDATNQELFLTLTPKADDLWFKMMSFLQGTEVRRASTP